MNTVNLKLLSLSTQTQFLQAEKCERLPSNYFDPTVRKQHAVRVAILLVNCLNSYIKTPLFPDKIVTRSLSDLESE